MNGNLSLVGPDDIAIMKVAFVFLIIAVISTLVVNAFVVDQHRQYRAAGKPRFEGIPCRESVETKLQHSDIVWKVRPTPGTSYLRKIWLRLASNLIRLDCKVMGKPLPLVLCPKGGQAVLEAHYRPDSSSAYRRIARFGFTTESGPSIPPMQQAVHEIYGIDPQRIVRVGAIIYMFVEESYRKKNVGVLALDVLSLIHAYQGFDFTVLVADDNGSGRLIDWYVENGYAIAPQLQECFGSPNEVHGKTMIAPTVGVLPDDCSIKWW